MVPCEGDVQVCPMQVLASLANSDKVTMDDIEGFFMQVYLELTEDACGDLLGRRITSVNAFQGITDLKLSINFGCLGGCEAIPTPPSIFDVDMTSLLPCEGSESECTGTPRAPSIEEFISEWNRMHMRRNMPKLEGLSFIPTTDSCQAATCANAGVSDGICQQHGFTRAVDNPESVACGFPCRDEGTGAPDLVCCANDRKR